MKIPEHNPSIPQLNQNWRWLRFGRWAALAATGLLAVGSAQLFAQSDDFDSYSNTSQFAAAGWILSSLNPALVTTTFPAAGSGKAVRIQANPVPNTAPAVGMWYRTNEYSDFYMAVDIVDWRGTEKNQAAVMFARMTDANTAGVVTNQNPATAQGVICNYDTSQYGENPTDRRQGQFQINVVGAGFDTITIAVAEITFEPGRSYRLVFKGQGFHYIAQAYDHQDLTTPLVTIEGDDPLMFHAVGACGFLAFSRQGTSGTADITFDNYYVGTNDPNPAPSPALAHPVAGTPALVTRVPAARYSNFVNPSAAISFTANTFSANEINAAATKMWLNGVEVSSQLNLSANGTNISGSLPASVLRSNTVYSAQIVVTDVAGTKSTTNTFWFDTFSDPFLLSSTVKTIEAEEYNYNSGQYQLDPIPVSGLDTNGWPVNGYGVGYYEALGTAGIDYSNRNSGPDFNFSKFRTADAVRTLSGGLLGIEDANHPTEFDPGSDNIRSQHAASNLLEYVVCRTEPTEWLNYTRKFDPALYAVYLRYSSFGATTNELHRVTSDPTQPDQTTAKLGTFVIPNNQRFVNYHYTPLVDEAGAPALLYLDGTNTLRLVIAGTPGQDNRKTMLNYILFVQVPVTLYSAATVDGTYAPEAGAVVDGAARTITVAASGSARFYRIGSSVPFTIKSIELSGSNVVLKF
jgi:hypothetical protein